MTGPGRVEPVTSANRPFWSVMIPVHRPDLSLLRQTVDSVLQSGLDRAASQIAVVEDIRSSPDLEAYLETLAAQGIEIIRAHGSAGLVENWNACLTHARGEWVHVLHQDDRVRPGFYAALADGIRQAPHLGAAFTQTAFVDEQGTWLRNGHLDQLTPGILEHWIQHVLVNLAIQCPAMVVRRAVYERLGGFDPRFAYCTDADMWQRIAAEYPLWFDPRPLAEYRVHAASATHRLFPLPQRWRERRTCLNRGLPSLSPVIRERARQSGLHYRTRLAWSEWKEAWRTTHQVGQRLRLLSWLPQLCSLRALRAIPRRSFPPAVPGTAPIRGLDPSIPRTPRLLILSEFFPHPPERAVFGVFQRLYRTLEGLARVGHVDAAFFWSDNYQVPDRVTATYREQLAAAWPLAGQLFLLSTTTGPAAEIHQRPLRALYWLLFGSASFMYAKPSLRCCGPGQVARLRDVLHTVQPDLIFAHRIGVMGPLIRLGQPLPPVVHDFDDIDHIKLQRFHTSARGWRAFLRTALVTWLARRSERQAARFATVSLVCSETDRDALRAVAPRARIDIIPNTAREREPHPLATAPTALFVGVAHYPPNREAIQWLVREIWPRVREKQPEARLLIVGDGATDLPELNPAPGIEVIGFVPDLDPYYRQAAIAVCPIQRGSGTRIKIIEAALCARPLVSTTIGAEGLTFVPDREILIADDTAAFATACISLLADPARREMVGQAARQKALSDYAPSKVVERMANLLSNTLAGNPGSDPA